MRWLICLAVVALCILCGLLGLTAGINLNPVSTIRFVPHWGSLGDWVAGTGAFAAVAVSLWVTRRSERKQEQREKEDIRIEQAASDLFASIRIVSHSFLPVTVKLVLVVGPNGGAFSVPQNTGEPVHEFPKRLEFREEMHFAWSFDNMGAWLHVVELFELDSLDQLTLEVWTTTERHKAPLDTTLCNFLAEAARSKGVQLLRNND